MRQKNLSVYKLTNNKCDTSVTEKYAAIIGLNPSNGARSPLLWNAAFSAHRVDASMLPMDVDYRSLPALLDALQNDERFIGGAVAVPYKENVASLLGKNMTIEAASIGAVNCIFRKNGKLHGTNTDGEASLYSYLDNYGSVSSKSVLVLGPGGAGKAVATYFSSALGKSGSMTLVARSQTENNFANRIGANFLKWDDLVDCLPSTDVVINCTPIGGISSERESPITSDDLATLRANAIVYDINYQPLPTQLLKLAQARGLAVLDGSQMNLEQAVVAFNFAMPLVKNTTLTRYAMKSILEKEQ